MNTSFLLKLQDFSKKHIHEDGHGFQHFMCVLEHVENALKWDSFDEKTIQLIRYAALLHDIDDHKFFPNNINYENARYLLKGEHLSGNDVETIINMISLVSCSGNGNDNNEDIDEWMLYPRYADRLEAVGDIGIERAISYGNHLNRPMHDDQTERVYTIDELNKVATPERFDEYVKKVRYAKTTIGHFYDKILHLANVKPANPYFKKQFEIRHQVIVKFILDYWNKDYFDK